MKTEVADEQDKIVLDLLRGLVKLLDAITKFIESKAKFPY